MKTIPAVLITFALVYFALVQNTRAVSPPPDGGYPGGNTAEGDGALSKLSSGLQNAALGTGALRDNTTGNYNTAAGINALSDNVVGVQNTAVGIDALLNSKDSHNVALGATAGENLRSGSGNVYIGSGIRGAFAEDNTTRVRNVHASPVTGRAVYVDSDNKLGTLSSSLRYKEEIKPMDKVSEAILALKPVAFRYKKEIDPAQMLSFGLIAEEVAKINSDLITRDEQGKPQTVRYEAVNAMLLNEFLKEHRKVQELEANALRQQKQIDTLTAGFQKVSAQLEANKPAPQVVNNP
jgi:hypothetical protein